MAHEKVTGDFYSRITSCFEMKTVLDFPDIFGTWWWALLSRGAQPGPAWCWGHRRRWSGRAASSRLNTAGRVIHDTKFIVLKMIDDDCDLTHSVLSNIITMRGLRHWRGPYDLPGHCAAKSLRLCLVLGGSWLQMPFIWLTLPASLTIFHFSHHWVISLIVPWTRHISKSSQNIRMAIYIPKY